MGKKIIIKSANFSANGMKESYTEFVTTTEQGYFNSSMSSSGGGKLGAQTEWWGYQVCVHSNEEIVLHAGDTIAIVEAPGKTNIVRIGAVALNSTGENMYPDLICDAENSTIIGTLLASAGGSQPPLTLTNTSSDDWIIILGAGTYKQTSPTAAERLVAKYVGGVEQDSPTTPEIAYRIYSDNLSVYEGSSAKEQNLDLEDDEDSENSGSIWDDNSGGDTENSNEG